MVMSYYYSFIAAPTQPPTHSWSYPQPSAHPAWSYPCPPSTLTPPSYTSPYPSPRSQVDVAHTLPPRPSAPGPLEPPPTALQKAATFVCRSFQIVPAQAPSTAPAHTALPRLSRLWSPSRPLGQAHSPLVAPIGHSPVKAHMPPVSTVALLPPRSLAPAPPLLLAQAQHVMPVTSCVTVPVPPTSCSRMAVPWPQTAVLVPMDPEPLPRAPIKPNVPPLTLAPSAAVHPLSTPPEPPHPVRSRLPPALVPPPPGTDPLGLLTRHPSLWLCAVITPTSPPVTVPAPSVTAAAPPTIAHTSGNPPSMPTAKPHASSATVTVPAVPVLVQMPPPPLMPLALSTATPPVPLALTSCRTTASRCPPQWPPRGPSPH